MWNEDHGQHTLCLPQGSLLLVVSVGKQMWNKLYCNPYLYVTKEVKSSIFSCGFTFL